MNLKFHLVLGTLMLTTSLLGQSKPPVPEMLNEVNYYNKSKHALQNLEKAKADYSVRPLSGAVDFVLTGEKSTVRLNSTDSISFVVTLGEGMGDPSAWFTLVKAEVKKNKRIGTYVQSASIYGSKSNSKIISYAVRKLGDGGFQLLISGSFEKGEYMFANRGTLGNYGGQAVDAFAFGVD